MEFAHKIISDDFFLIWNWIEKNTDLHWSIIMKFKSRFCSDFKLINVKKIIEKMNTLICTFHFWLHNSTAHLSNVLKLSRSFETQWNLLCWKYKIKEFYFGSKHKNHKFTNHRNCNFLPNHENWYPRRKVLSQ